MNATSAGTNPLAPTTRSYRPAMSVPDAVAELERCSGSHFDPHVVRGLVRVATVSLGTGSTDVAQPVPVPDQNGVPPTVLVGCHLRADRLANGVSAKRNLHLDRKTRAG